MSLTAFPASRALEALRHGGKASASAGGAVVQDVLGFSECERLRKESLEHQNLLWGLETFLKMMKKTYEIPVRGGGTL